MVSAALVLDNYLHSLHKVLLHILKLEAIYMFLNNIFTYTMKFIFWQKTLLEQAFTTSNAHHEKVKKAFASKKNKSFHHRDNISNTMAQMITKESRYGCVPS